MFDGIEGNDNNNKTVTCPPMPTVAERRFSNTNCSGPGTPRRTLDTRPSSVCLLSHSLSLSSIAPYSYIIASEPPPPSSSLLRKRVIANSKTALGPTEEIEKRTATV